MRSHRILLPGPRKCYYENCDKYSQQYTYLHTVHLVDTPQLFRNVTYIQNSDTTISFQYEPTILHLKDL